MAMLIRDMFDLPTLRCWFEFRHGDPASPEAERCGEPRRVVVSQIYQGSEAVGAPAESDPALLGVGLTAEERRSAAPIRLAGTPIGAQLQAAFRSSSDPVLWFHIPREGFELALLPWEEMLYEHLQVSLLRIANFLEDPYRPSIAPTMVICASAPIADGAYSLHSYVSAMLRALDLAASIAKSRPTIYVFADAEAIPSIQSEVFDKLVEGNRLANLDVMPLPAPMEPAGLESPGRGADDVISPWLRWILARMSGQAVDIVHFISPGYFQEDRGALALAESPDSNSGRGDFVGAGELASFYDRLGCSVMSFSSPDMPQWAWGQRMLAFELSWLRPGPVLVYEREYSGYGALARVYALLFGAGRQPLLHWPFGRAPVHLCCHPRLLEPADLHQEFALHAFESAKVELPTLFAQKIRLARAQLAPTRPLSQTEVWERSGAEEALSFLSDVSEM
jgi:hypothetical protein